MVNILFSDRPDNWAKWEGPLRDALKERGITADLHCDASAVEKVDYIIYAPHKPNEDFTRFLRLKAVFSMWAGVETLQKNQTLNVPLTRMVDPGLTQGMVEYVTTHVLRYHQEIDYHIHNHGPDWREDLIPKLASDRKVGILGLGALGMACAHALANLNFDVAGWSRSQKTDARVTCLFGDDGLNALLSVSEILVLLLPLTDATRDMINAERISLMPRGARLINPGRGPLIVDEDLLTALDSGSIGHATLDVFRKEPLPAEHAYWSHPKVTVTPHIAAATHAETAAHVIAENVARAESGAPLLHLVDRDAGY